MRWEVQPDFGMLEAATWTQAADSQNRNHRSGSGSGSSSFDSSYASPLTEILKSIRRQNPIAAAAASTSPVLSKLMMSEDAVSDDIHSGDLLSPGDPLEASAYLSPAVAARNQNYGNNTLSVETMDSEDPAVDDSIGECKCQFIGRRSSIKSGTLDICTHCGKRRRQPATEFRRRRSVSATQQLQNHLSYLQKKEMKQHPGHAMALLQTTPQLRFICPASTDMQVSGYTGNLNIIQRSLMPLASVLEGGHPSPGTGLGGGKGVKTQFNSVFSEYKGSLIRNRSNQQAASELAGLLWILSHEMSQEDFYAVESRVFSEVFGLVHSSDKQRRMAGLAALDALLAAPSADDEKKSIKCANTLSAGLRAANGDFEYLSAVSQALGHMATKTANVDLVESEVTRALEWLGSERSDRRLAACLSLKQFAINAPTTFHSKTSQSGLGQGGSNEFLDHIFQAIRDPQPIVRACAVDALSHCLAIIVERRHFSMTGLLCKVHFSLLEGLGEDLTRKRPWQAVVAAEASQHGSLLVVSTMLACASQFMIPRFEEVCDAVLTLRDHSKALIRLEVVRLIPRLANANPQVFGRRYLEESLLFLMASVSTPTGARIGVDIRPSAYKALGQLILGLVDEDTGEVIGSLNAPTIKVTGPPGESIFELKPQGIIFEKLESLFALVKMGLKQMRTTSMSSSAYLGFDSTREVISPVLHCAANLVAALGELANRFIPDMIDDMFRAGLSNDLIRCLQSVARCAPNQQDGIEDRILQEVSFCLAGVRDVYDPLSPTGLMGLSRTTFPRNDRDAFYRLGDDLGNRDVRIEMSSEATTVSALVLSLQTLASFGGTIRKAKASGNTVPLLPFVQKVTSRYLAHPSSEVRKSAVLTCCALLLPYDVAREGKIGGHTGVIVDEVLEKLLRVAVSDPSGIVRICVVQALDSRYDAFLCQRHHLPDLCLLLQDENMATRAAGLRLLGRLAAINPAPVLPVMRRVLNDLIVEMQCGTYAGRAREEATRLCVVFCRAKPFQRLVQPMLPSLIKALPLNGPAPPRLASASLEALGEIAQASGVALKPWIDELFPRVLEIMRDQSSASKQKTSLRTLGQIASSTGYVIRPYLNYPTLLPQATDILPATKRAPWSLRREVIRSLGILGALDPDRYHSSVSKGRKAGVVGGAYFEEAELAELIAEEVDSDDAVIPSQASDPTASAPFTAATSREPHSGDDDLPAYLFMHEQYAMFAQPMSELRPAKRITPADDGFYPTVAIQALMRIFRDPNLAAHHTMVIQAVMFIFKSMGLQCVPFLRKVVPHMLTTVRTCTSNSLRESMLKQIARLSLIVREHLRPYVADIFDVAESFWSTRHLATIFGLISNIAVGVPDAFHQFVPRLIRRLLSTFDDLQVAEWTESDKRNSLNRSTERLHLLLHSLSNLKGVLGGYLHILVPALLKLADSLASLDMNMEADVPKETLIEISILVFRTMSILIESQNASSNRVAFAYQTSFTGDFSLRQSSEKGLPSRVVQPIVRLLREKPTRSISICLAMVETLCVCVKLVGAFAWVNLYDSVVRSALTAWQNHCLTTNTSRSTFSLHGVGDTHPQCLSIYNNFLEDMMRPAPDSHGIESGNKPSSALFSSHFGDGFIQPLIDNTPETYEPMLLFGNSPHKHKVNQRNLQRAWDVSQRSSRDDWDEWMRRFSIQLLREAPAPALRSTASLAQAYQPLSRELFSAAFACCWNELSSPYRVNLVHALETAFVADVSPEILQALLNLAEFMEYDPTGGLPIDIPILADLALKCRAYGKALHYKEKEYSLGGGTGCVESLISINRKLDLQEAALGVLKASSTGVGRSYEDGIQENLSSKFSRHQTLDMCHSVIWSTDERQQTKGEPVDLMAKEELWLAKLGAWTDALSVYESKLSRNPSDFQAILGCMRCLGAIGESKKVLDLADENWDVLSGNAGIDTATPHSRRKAIRICAQSAWRLGQWDKLEKFSSQLVGSNSPFEDSQKTSTEYATSKVDFEGSFYSAVLRVHRKQWAPAAEAIDAARKAMDSRLTALMAESYSRAYSSMVTAQTLAELEEIISLRRLEEDAKSSSNQHELNRPNAEKERQRLLSVWKDRLAGCRVDADVHAAVLAVRSLVVRPDEEVDATLTLSKLSRQAQQFRFAERVLLDPLESLNADINGPVFGIGLPDALRVVNDFSSISSNSVPNIMERVLAGDLRLFSQNFGSAHEQWSRKIVGEAGGISRVNVWHRLYFAYVKHLWYTDRKDEAMNRLSYFCDVVEMIARCEGSTDTSLRVACWLELGEWKVLKRAPPGTPLSESLQMDALVTFKRATMMEKSGYRAWHSWALLNLRIVMEQRDRETSDKISPSDSARMVRNHIVAAVKGFVNAITLGTRKWCASVQQDLLNLLTCLFQYGKLHDVAAVIKECIGSVVIEAWLGVLPQLLARIHIVDPSIRAVLHPLLIRLGEKHPQALMYPLSVLLNSPVAERKASAESLMNSLKAHSSALVEEAQMVSSELIRVAILLAEMWHEGLEDASRLYFGEGNAAGMLDLLFPLHEMLEKGPETRMELDFLNSFGKDLSKAHSYIKEYSRLVSLEKRNTSVTLGGKFRSSEEAETAMNRAWDIYYIVFRKINKQLPSLTKLELSQCSPSLSNARSLELGVPGSYRVDGSYIKIERVHSEVEVITSKQRPRKITMRGSDGKSYLFLLKGHEDLRQDERVMQLFGLVNALLVRDLQTKKFDLRIQRYAISALSHNCGVVGWVPHSDTLHSLIRDYRLSKKIPLNMENREMQKIVPEYDILTVMQKVEVFTEALKKTTGGGKDLGEILWLKSTNSEEWLDRRTKFTRSLAVMSMVGYVLGLGDRHPSNIMLDKVSGRILHIDFGDCFEVAMNRDKYPEKVPFRLTRMLIKAMEVSGIEGSYRSTCERTMSILRGSRDSLVTMLEAFVYDPLISWRLADLSHSGTSRRSSANRPGTSATTDLDNRDSTIEAAREDTARVQSIREAADEDNDEEDQIGRGSDGSNNQDDLTGTIGTERARSMQMYANIQNLAANLTTDSRIASIAGERSDQVAAEGSMARSRIEKSMKQRELLILLRGADGAAVEEALNEKALKVIRRVQDKLTGTDFPESEGQPLDVTDQVQRLIVQATSCENLCQLFIGWCSFW